MVSPTLSVNTGRLNPNECIPDVVFVALNSNHKNADPEIVIHPPHIMVPPSHTYASLNMLDRRLDLSGLSLGGIGKSSRPLPLSLAVTARDSCDLPAFLFAVPGRERGASRLGKGVTSGASSSTT